MAGLARAQGGGGRSSGMDPSKLATATARLPRGQSVTRIANALKVSRATVYRHTDITPARGHSG
jgi:DNA invertase Pin-like site-specific DNA recombinase